MKYLSILVVALILVVSPAVAQKRELRKFFKEYRGESTSTFRFGLGRVMLKLASWVVPASAMSEDSVPLKHMLSHLHRMKIYTIEGYDPAHPPVKNEDVQRLKNTLINKEKYDQLVEVRDGSSLVHVLNKGKEDELGNMVILVQDETDFVIVYLKTTLKMKDVNSLVNHFAKN
ncbi:DUF4252 domain-containing protein [Chitinophaga tropicalis]|uniref:DUF4252 domain-containing protein n=1 Tax=Chitinophaga tropicalis TaxID=2683588 RepID=A0A7K1U2T6_9BACT|nr:DUF4252 domain-containing protein [Chitinophaga tropicalis]MVT08651.1 DUF4252 domain-containing protein [Chitinophaga tropicalis]